MATMMMWILVGINLFHVVPAIPVVSITNTTKLFVPDRDGFPLFRIPSLAKINATHIVAFAEGRGKGSVQIVSKV